MVSIGQRILNGTIESIKNAPLQVIVGALWGYVYAKFADLPAGQSAKAWAIWIVAEQALLTFADQVIESKSIKATTVITINTTGTYLGITEMRKRGLMGDKMMIFMFVMYVLTTLNAFTDLAQDNV
jgi:hypothetical protein